MSGSAETEWRPAKRQRTQAETELQAQLDDLESQNKQAELKLKIQQQLVYQKGTPAADGQADASGKNAGCITASSNADGLEPYTAAWPNNSGTHCTALLTPWCSCNVCCGTGASDGG